MDAVEILRLPVTKHNLISKYHPWYSNSGFPARNGTAQIFHRHLCSFNTDNLDVLYVYVQTLCQVGNG